MSIKTITFVFVFAFLAMLSTVSAQAATIIDKTISQGTFILPVNVCNSSAEVVGNFTSTYTLWDNDHYNLRLLALGDIIDSTSGEKIGTYIDQESTVQATGDLPFIVLLNSHATCNGSGIAESIHLGLTIDENGSVHLHGLN